MNLHPKPGRLPKRVPAFSLVETVIVVAVIGLVSMIGVTVYGNLKRNAQETKLSSDVDGLNRAAKSYEASYGNLAECQTPEEVLAKLRSAATSGAANRILGFTGSFVDPGIFTVSQTEKEAASNDARVYWDPTSRRFIIAREGPPGVKAFDIDADAGAVANQTDERRPTMSLATKDKWIWDYADRTPPPPPPGPSTIAVATVVDPAPVAATTPPPGLKSLLPPNFSLATTSRPISDFDLPVLLTNPNPNGSSYILYSVDYGEWKPFDGTAIPVAPGGVLRAQAITEDVSLWSSSKAVSHTYTATPVTLDPPTILASATRFDPASVTVVDIQIANPNDPAVSKIVYRIGNGSWQSYTAPFQLSQSDHPSGADIEAKAVAAPPSPYYLDSTVAKQRIEGTPQPLDPPVILFSHDAFSSDSSNPVTAITVQINNPNPSGSSTILYQILPAPGGPGTPTAYLDYSGSFTVPQSLFPSGFGVRAYAKSISPNYEDSEEAVRFATTAEGVFGGHLDLDTSTVLASVGTGDGDFDSLMANGKVKAHTHDYTGKNNLMSVDFFTIPESNHVEIDEALTVPGKKFKILVANGSLSPGLKIILHQERNNSTQRISLHVNSYDDLEIEDLPVFTLDGSGGTTKLTGLQIAFDQDVIYNAGVLPTHPGEVIDNAGGKQGEWRNGALTVQAVSVDHNGKDAFTTDVTKSNGGVQGVATAGLIWEGMLYWHWGGDAYNDPNNKYKPGDFSSIADEVE